MHRNTLETVMGAIVLLAAAGFVALAYEAADVKGSGGYEIAAEFGSTGGLSVGVLILKQISSQKDFQRRLYALFHRRKMSQNGCWNGA